MDKKKYIKNSYKVKKKIGNKHSVDFPEFDDGMRDLLVPKTYTLTNDDGHFYNYRKIP